MRLTARLARLMFTEAFLGVFPHKVSVAGEFVNRGKCVQNRVSITDRAVANKPELASGCPHGWLGQTSTP